MPARFAFPRRLKLVGDHTVATSFIARGDALLGIFMNLLAESGLLSGKRVFRENGVVYTVSYDRTLASLQIDVTTGGETPPVEVSSIWLPRGFIVYPASDASPNGWGTPVIPADDSPYATTNLAPGLDVSRWTANGRLGEVLITKDDNAGYPAASKLVAPLMASEKTGIRLGATFKRTTPGATWAGYRIEFTSFSPQSPGASAQEIASLIAAKRSFYKIVNDHRVSLGRDPFLLPIRGRFDNAQATTECENATSTFGHNFYKYPDGYKASTDRSAKDGLVGYINPTNAASRDAANDTAEESTGSPNATVTATYLDPSGFDTQTIAGGSPISPQAAFDSYMDEPLHKLGIEAQQWDGGHTSVEYGFKTRFHAMNFFPNTAWVHAGNRSWRSRHPEIPVVSWFGFTSLNLAYETFPVVYNSAAEFTTPGTTSPPGFDPLTIQYPLVQGATKTGAWLTTWYSYDQGFNYNQTPGPTLNFSDEQIPYIAPTMDSRIFAYGRCIAIAPPVPGGSTAGYVWAAAIQKFDSPDVDKFNVYRLVALVHHPEDQTLDQKSTGMTSFLRVWYCDLPNDGPIPCAPHAIIREAFGHEDHGWPWDVIDSPWSWKGGALLDVGTTDGSTRDALKYASQWVFSSDGFKAICLRDQGTYADYNDLWVFGSGGTAPAATVPYIGLRPRALELLFGGNQFNPLTTTKVWYAQNPGSIIPVGWTDPSKYVAELFAAGYDLNDNPHFAFEVFNERLADTAVDNAGKAWLVFADYGFVPTGPAGLLYSNGEADPATPAITASTTPAIMDLIDEVVVSVGFYQPTLKSGDVSIANPAYNRCWINSSQNVGAVNAWRGGVLLQSTPFANPDKTVINIIAFECTFFGTYLTPAINRLIVPSYVTDGHDWILSYVIVPQAGSAFYIPTPGTCGGGLTCAPSANDGINTITPVTIKPVTRGGWVGGSIDVPQLAQIPGAAPRVLYARAA